MEAIAPEDVELDIWAIDVGQGDATLIVGPEVDAKRFAMLVDAGQGRSTRAVEPGLAAAGVTQLDVFVATHFDDDHVGGATTVKGSSVLLTTSEVDGELQCEARAFFPSQAIVDPGPSPLSSGEPTQTEQQWHACVAQLAGGVGQPKHLVVKDGAHLGDTFDLGRGYTATLLAGGGEVFGAGTIEGVPDSKNEMSIALLVSNTEGFDFLVTGDLIGQPGGSDMEDARLEREVGENLRTQGVNVEVLQVGHHGAENATEDEFIAAIRPTVAIISVGKRNSHGHPHNQTLATLEERGVRFILQTSEGKLAESVEPHEFEDCEDTDPDCIETRQIAVDGTLHIAVDGPFYDIRSVENSSYDFEDLGTSTRLVALECNDAGCERVE